MSTEDKTGSDPGMSRVERYLLYVYGHPWQSIAGGLAGCALVLFISAVGSGWCIYLALVPLAHVQLGLLLITRRIWNRLSGHEPNQR